MKITPLSRILAASIATFLAVTAPAGATTYTWDGGSPSPSGNSNISTAANWNPDLAPTSGITTADLVFTGTTRTTPNFSVAFSARTVTFNNFPSNNPFTFSGLTLTVGTGGIVNNDANTQTFNNTVTIGGATSSLDAATGPLSFAGDLNIGTNTVTLPGNFGVSIPTGAALIGTGTLTKSGTGTLTLVSSATSIDADLNLNAGTTSLTGTTAQSFSGTIAVGAAGTFNASGNISFASTGQLTVASGGVVGPSGNVTFDGGAQLSMASGSTMTILPGKTLTVQAGSDATFTGGYTLGGGNITVTGAGSTLQTATSGALTIASGSIVAVQSGAALSTVGALNIGTVTTGALTVDGASSVSIFNNSKIAVGASGALSGTITQNAGTVTFYSDAGVTIGGTGQLSLGDTANAGTVTYDLNGGTLTVPKISTSGGTSTFDFNGGTLRAAASSTTFLAGLTNGVVKIGGAFIDTNSHDITIAQTLVAGSGSTGGLTKSGAGTLTLSGANTYVGATSVTTGWLRLGSANALPGGTAATGGLSNLTLAGGVVELATGDFSRGAGTGATQVQWTGNGGFGAVGANRAVNLGGTAATQTWATGSFVPNGSTLVLSSAGSNGTLDFQNPIALGTAARTVQVDNGSATVDALLSGALSGGAGSALVKTGTGTLNLTGAQNYAVLTTSSGTTNVNGSFTGGTATVNANAPTTFGSSQTLAALNIGGGALDAVEAVAAPSTTSVPEPGAIASLLVSALGLLGRRAR